MVSWIFAVDGFWLDLLDIDGMALVTCIPDVPRCLQYAEKRFKTFPMNVDSDALRFKIL